jgi:hypothetical protein
VRLAARSFEGSVSMTGISTSTSVSGPAISTLLMRTPSSVSVTLGADLAKAIEHGAFDARKLLGADFAHLESHLRFHQRLVQARFVVHLLIDERRDLVEDEAQAAEEEIVDEQHVRCASQAA